MRQSHPRTSARFRGQFVSNTIESEHLNDIMAQVDENDLQLLDEHREESVKNRLGVNSLFGTDAHKVYEIRVMQIIIVS
ncbi:MAG: hypothetical protein CMI52_02990 [Parcubacteria group bacterium]|nr:hypothetical protein [Parcubacteria group bacterium]|tara:strand:+ start:206 stop:442 length:237 start_codon:yes stop_codon:yes gene_type:complete